MRQGLRTILDLEPGLEVVGEAADGQAGVSAALDTRLAAWMGLAGAR